MHMYMMQMRMCVVMFVRAYTSLMLVMIICQGVWLEESLLLVDLRVIGPHVK